MALALSVITQSIKSKNRLAIEFSSAQLGLVRECPLFKFWDKVFAIYIVVVRITEPYNHQPVVVTQLIDKLTNESTYCNLAA